MPPDSLTLTPVSGDPFNGGAKYQFTPVEGNPFEQNMAVADYARTLPAPTRAPLDDFGYAPPSVPQPALPGLAGVAGDPSRSMAVRIPAAIGSSLADKGLGLARSAWGAATLPGDVARGLVDPSSPEAVRRSTDLAGLLTLPAAAGEFNPDVMNAGPITAYHGSPHSFDQFDLSKIGTGEGAQAYGHGLYFAESENVAKSYRTTIGSAMGPNEAENVANARLFSDKASGDRGVAIKQLTDTIKLSQSPTRNAMLSDAIKFLSDPTWEPKRPGSMYQVAINADPEHLLDWDKPLSEQHPMVQQNLSTLPVEGINDLINYPGYGAKHLVPELNNQLGAEGAAQAIRDAGIPGIKYLDAGSRGAGTGSQNFVVLDDRTISILKKYGLAGLGIGAGGAALMGQDQPAQASGFKLTPVEGDPFAQ